MIAYLDSSAAVARYLPEAGSAAVRSLFRGRRKLAVSRLAFVELTSAVCRAHRQLSIDLQQRNAILARLPGDISELDFVVELTATIQTRAAELLSRHALRAYDAIQLASCLDLRGHAATELWAADRDLLAVARSEGLKVVAL